MPFSPSTIFALSPALTTPVSPSMVAWAIEPSMSCFAMRQSKPIDAFSALRRSSTSPLMRPAQSFIAIAPFREEVRNCPDPAAVFRSALPSQKGSFPR